jgi:uncharacterized protein YkwD
MQVATTFSIICSIAFLLINAVLPHSVSAQEPEQVATWLTLVNEARLDEGLPPYSPSSLLSAAAQRHADDLATNGITDSGNVHIGSDGTSEHDRIAEAGYAAWTWNGGNLIVDENVWSGQGDPEDGMRFFLDDQVHRENVLSETYREIGIGVATDEDGASYYVLDFGVRPNVLPIFINDGAASTDNPEIAIRLTNETARPEGKGGGFMGKAIEIRISNEPTFEGLAWQDWAPLVPWTLPETPGEHTVYVQFRDAGGRTAASSDSIFLDTGTPVTATPIPPSPTATPTPTATTVPPSPTPEPTATAVPPTPTPVPSASPPAPGSPSPPPLTSSPSPPLAATPSPAFVLVSTPFPTWTPLSSPEPTVDAETSTSPPDDYGPLLSIAAVLQGLAVILGLFLSLHRGGSSADSQL